METSQIVLASRPVGRPDLNNFRLQNMTLPSLEYGQVRLKGSYYSVDPYMRGRMNAGKSYVPPFEVDQSLSGNAVASVSESMHPEFKVGDTVVGMLPWAKECVVSGNELRHINPKLVSPSYFLGVLGMPGITAYFGVMDICKPKSGEVFVVSGAAGAVGLVAAQIAKLKGAKVVGIAGSEEKIQLLKNDFGFDEVINYKTTVDMKAAIEKACPNGVDMYFDNVGGEISDAVITSINSHARIAICGQISHYNETKLSMGPRLLTNILVKSALVKGFLVFDYQERYPEAVAQLAEWVDEGLVQFKETTIEGFEKLPEALLGLFNGDNIGKMVVKI